MIRVTIDMIPLGNEAAKFPLGIIEISNVGPSDPKHPQLDSYRYDIVVKQTEAGGPPVTYRQVDHGRRSGYFELLVFTFVKLWNGAIERD